MSEHEAVVLLDFDGVLCDSTRECMVVGTLARETRETGIEVEHLDAPTLAPRLRERPQGPMWEHFRRHRPYVRWPREYLLVFESFDAERGVGHELDLDDFAEWEATGGSLAERFEQDFFACRHLLREHLYDDWIQLFDVHERVLTDAGALANQREVRILTGRDAPSVQAVLRAAGWDVPTKSIFDAERFRNKVEGFQAIRTELGAHRRYQLLDDNILHLRALLPLSVEGYWATWGYVTDDHRAVGEELADSVTRCEIGNWLDRILEE